MRRALKSCPRFAPVVVPFCLAGMPGSRAEAQNFPLIARAALMPEEVFLGEPTIFSSADSLDPDEGPQPLRFLWGFEDGDRNAYACRSRKNSFGRADATLMR